MTTNASPRLPCPRNASARPHLRLRSAGANESAHIPVEEVSLSALVIAEYWQTAFEGLEKDDAETLVKRGGYVEVCRVEQLPFPLLVNEASKANAVRGEPTGSALEGSTERSLADHHQMDVGVSKFGHKLN